MKTLLQILMLCGLTTSLAWGDSTLSVNWTSEGAQGGIGGWLGHDSVVAADGSVYTVLRNPVLQSPNQLVVSQIRSDGTPGWISPLPSNGAVYFYPGEIAVDNAGNVYFSAYVRRTNPSVTKLMTAKVDSSGIELWRSERNIPNHDVTASALRLTNTSQVVAAGRGSLPGETYDGIYVTSHDVNGNFLWERLLSDPLVDVVERVRIETDSAGNIWVLGDDENGRGPILAKLNAVGGVVWQGHPLYSPVANTLEQLLIDGADSVYLVFRDSSATTYIRRFASDGSDAGQWSIPSPSGFADRYYAAAVAGANDLVLTGGRRSSLTSLDSMLVARTRPEGVQWTLEYPAITDAIGRALALRHDQSIVVVGGYSLEGSSDASAIIHVGSRGELLGAGRVDMGAGIGEFCSEALLLPSSAICAGVTYSGGSSRQLASSWTLDQLTGAGFE